MTNCFLHTLKANYYNSTRICRISRMKNRNPLEWIWKWLNICSPPAFSYHRIKSELTEMRMYWAYVWFKRTLHNIRCRFVLAFWTLKHMYPSNKSRNGTRSNDNERCSGTKSIEIYVSFVCFCHIRAQSNWATCKHCNIATLQMQLVVGLFASGINGQEESTWSECIDKNEHIKIQCDNWIYVKR